ncbi:restriction endonuclease subunit S [bacterium]|nr:restriction endonuclease subunit S [bacterium]
MKQTTNFKETEIGLIPSDWDVKEFKDCVDKESISRDIKIPRGKYNKAGKYSIIDQGAEFIAGYTDDKGKLYSGSLPVIVFGDHTRIFKFVDFPFSVGADGTKLIQPKDFLHPKYLFYYLSGLSIESKGYNRHYKYLKEKVIAYPLQKSEQQKIASVLSKVQQAIEQQDKIIQITKELKKSLMNKLFTEGLHGEEQKETEIGLIPKSWGVVKIQDCCEVVTGGTPRTEVKEYYEGGTIRWMKSGDISGGLIYEVKNRITELGLINSNAKPMPKGTIVIALSGRGKTRGTTSILMVECSCSQSVAGMIPDIEKIDSFYLHYFLSYIYNKLRNITGDKDRSGLNLGLVRQIKIAKPKDINEQKEIANILSNIDKKISQAEARRQALQSLFKTMLNQLMTGKVRVKNMDIEVN